MCDARVDYCYVRVPGSDWQMCGQSSGESSRRWYNNNNNINNIINGFSLCLFNSYTRSRSNSVVAFPSSAAPGFHRVIRKPAWYKSWCKTTVNFGCDVILFHTCIGRSFFRCALQVVQHNTRPLLQWCVPSYIPAAFPVRARLC